ncbi:universal stress protein [Sphingomicrobium lutaoense]|uniref:Nucleotide-binding universal stress UspA family protein n=1 Tax=Sphingomicrobium lutaoense TaxID=515949 RepID=A0A839Z063_9SPHN|nr:universal stress protein [Sphingomicrobium lutaoense]MBB3763072.1 nucleotide-binding universal stress UspA family protein [Sphingomicrobium lutaoense]
MKTILLHVQDDQRVDIRIENALAIARAAGAHLDVLHIMPEEAIATFESFGGIDVDGKGKKALLDAEQALEDRVKAELSNEDVSWDYTRVTGQTVNCLASRAALADLIVTGRISHRQEGRATPIQMLGDLLHQSRSPLFLRGDEDQRFDPCGPAIVAWDGSFEAANAVRNAGDLLSLASDVHVVRVTERGEEVPAGLYPVTRVLEYLSRRGVHAEYHRIAEKNGKVTEALMDHAEKHGAGLLVSGAYSHSRIGEFFFGGVTRSLLKACPIALAIAH